MPSLNKAGAPKQRFVRRNFPCYTPTIFANHSTGRHFSSTAEHETVHLFETSRHSPVKNLYCSLLSGTTLSLPCRTSGESANSLLALTSASVTGLPDRFPTLIFT